MDRDRLENTINVAEVCRFITQMGVHELVDANIVVAVVFSKERSHHLLKLISIYIPDVALKSVEVMTNVKLDIVETLGGANDQVISEVAKYAAV